MEKKEFEAGSFEKKSVLPPKLQLALMGGMSVVGMLGAALLAQKTLTIWLISATLALLFSIMNNGLGVFAPNYKSYLTHSVYCFMILFVGSIALATVLSGQSIFEAGGYRNIFIIILVANFILISMVMMIKGLLVILNEKDRKM